MSAVGLGLYGWAVMRNVRRFREGQRLTYVELAAKLDSYGRPIPVLGLRRIERGERRVDVDDLYALSAALGVPVDHLVTAAACHSCKGNPPAGFICASCGASTP